MTIIFNPTFLLLIFCIDNSLTVLKSISQRKIFKFIFYLLWILIDQRKLYIVLIDTYQGRHGRHGSQGLVLG